MDKITRRRNRKLAKLIALVNEIRPSIVAQINKLSKCTSTDYSMANCLFLNGLAHQRLLDNDFPDATLCGGEAAFGFSKNQFGMLELNPRTTNPLMIQDGFIPTFRGHCWVEIKSLNVIVDLTMPDMEKTVIKSNQQLGITDSEFHLQEDMVIAIESTFTYDEIFNGQIGHHFKKTPEGTNQATSKVMKALNLACA
ncbi:hypothetical protein [Vibrio owensii]|uniref:hypothetical protein n=1 Tax=Vibrio owensii TaxID=696485 RepID=UPI0018F275E0|nr:hypothetical protein [Vibrio owensii]